ncbi:MAG: CinA family nicotinamide mononucleotide deamidase-related protein [Chloroflexi bacterium]|nr:CinA family nicotinamide mononucleotide deamidase-related protein [Chloroflexota bacterium]
MAVAEIVTIGTELLLGEIQDTNSKYIARVLRDIGVDLYRLTTVGDNIQRITATLQEALMRADIVITTGGLGPTVDDPTRQAVANVFNLPLVYHEELWEQILERFTRNNRKPTENNRRQAYVPQNSRIITNEVGTAPAFAFEWGTKTIISLPGVPREMEHLIQTFVLDYLKKRYALQDEIIKAHVVHTVSLGESSIDELIGELETLSNPTVGLLAHPGQTDVRITAKAHSEVEAVRMIEPVLAEIYEKLGPYIYGENETTIDQSVVDLLKRRDLKLTVVECGTHGEISARLTASAPDRINGENVEIPLSEDTLKSMMSEFQTQKKTDLTLGVRLTKNHEKQDLLVILYYAGQWHEDERSYGGPPGDGQLWAFNSALGYVRSLLINNEKKES